MINKWEDIQTTEVCEDVILIGSALSTHAMSEAHLHLEGLFFFLVQLALHDTVTSLTHITHITSQQMVSIEGKV